MNRFAYGLHISWFSFVYVSLECLCSATCPEYFVVFPREIGPNQLTHKVTSIIFSAGDYKMITFTRQKQFL